MAQGESNVSVPNPASKSQCEPWTKFSSRMRTLNSEDLELWILYICTCRLPISIVSSFPPLQHKICLRSSTPQLVLLPYKLLEISLVCTRSSNTTALTNAALKDDHFSTTRRPPQPTVPCGTYHINDVQPNDIVTRLLWQLSQQRLFWRHRQWHGID